MVIIVKKIGEFGDIGDKINANKPDNANRTPNLRIVKDTNVITEKEQSITSKIEKGLQSFVGGKKL